MADIKQIKVGNDTYDIKDAAARGGLSSKVDKVTGKGLSTNDYTTDEKNKLAGIPADAAANVQADFAQTDTSADDYIKNKPVFPDVSGKADKVSGATSGDVATLNAGGNLVDSGKTLGKSVPSDAVFTDTKNTAGSTDTGSKIYLIGATSQAANPQTYSQDTAFVGTDGCLYSDNKKVLTDHQSISGKADKVSNATSGNFAGLDSNGNLTDSGKKASDFLTEHQPAVRYDTASQGLTDTQKANARTNIGVPDFGEIVSTEPYTFRKGLGTMADMDIVGGTVAWNQLMTYANTTYVMESVTITRNNGLITMTGTANASSNTGTVVGNIKLIKGHKYIFGCPLLNLPISNNKVVHVQILSDTQGTSTFEIKESDTNNHKIFSYNYEYEATYRLRIRIQKDVTYDTKEYLQLFDLTAMFGSTIADYIYSLEQTNEGDGVAWFRKLFPADYYPYDAGSLKSVEGLQSRDVSGFNQWDEEFESGIYNNETGAKEPNQNAIRNKNLIHVLPSTTYCSISSNFFGRHKVYFDANGDFIRYAYNNSVDNKVIFTTPANACYMGWWSSQGQTTYSNDTCLNLSDPAKNGTYEPYRRYSYPLDSSLTLRGIPKLDSNNELYYDGDEYESDGTVTRRYGIVDLGTLTWTYNTTYAFLYAEVSGKKNNDINNALISSNYTFVSGNISSVSSATLALNEDRTFGVSNGTSKPYVYIRDDSYTDAATFKEAMSGVMLVYELATPTTESAQPYQKPQRAFSDGTEGFTMTGIVPVGNNTTYQLSKALIPAEDYTDGAVDIVQRGVDGKAGKDMISDAWVSGQAYSVRDYCIYEDMIYRCIQNVTQGTAILPTNTSYWTPTKIAAEIKSAKSDSNFALLGIAALEESLTSSYRYNTDALNMIFQSYDSSIFPAITDSDCVIVYGNIVLIHLSVGGDLASNYIIGRIKESMRPPFRGSTVYTAEVDTTMVITPLSGTAFDYSVVHVRIASNGDMIMSPFSPLKNNATGTFTLMYIKSS